jgi:biotin transport system substrate-specific component
MNTTVILDRYRFHRLRVTYLRYHSGIIIKLMLSLSFAVLTALTARVSFYLPWTPVPVTGQTFAVLMSGVLLGRWGAASQIMYIGLALAGVPWLAGGTAVPAGPTWGYLAGFVVSSFAIGSIVDRYEKIRTVRGLIAVMSAANFLFIHGLGLAFLAVWISMIQGKPTGIYDLLSMGSLPFIPGDIIKILLASLFSCAILPKCRYINKIHMGE